MKRLKSIEINRPRWVGNLRATGESLEARKTELTWLNSRMQE